MALKLFRSTGYSSILAPGETRVTKHPGWLALAVSLWAGFVCNVLLWRAIAALPRSAGLPRALVLGAFIAAGYGMVLSLLGWRKTLKPAATLVLFMAGLSACAIWGQALPMDSIAEVRVSRLLMPTWATLLRWQVSLLLVVLAVVPTIWVWNTQIRRLPGPAQLSANMTGMLIAAVVLGASGFLLFRGAV
jgi:glucan phosphoethanolaminetransferase (alkaline phosphatase superfamily)